jgi:hypothetical protein
MAPRTSTATADRYVVEEVASPAATKRLFGIDDERAAKLTKWAEDALRAVEPSASPRAAASKPKPAKRRRAKQASAKKKSSVKR